jgi:uncharacterized protein YdhG (YjbR/CyaY superfamily)
MCEGLLVSWQELFREKGKSANLLLMATVNFQAVFEKFPKEQQKALLATIVAAEALFPRAERAIAWGMPTLKIGDDNLCHVMGFKGHNSLFPASGSIAEHLEKELANYSVSKGTIQFDLAKPFPKPLLKKIFRIFNFFESGTNFPHVQLFNLKQSEREASMENHGIIVRQLRHVAGDLPFNKPQRKSARAQAGSVKLKMLAGAVA